MTDTQAVIDVVGAYHQAGVEGDYEALERLCTSEKYEQMTGPVLGTILRSILKLLVAIVPLFSSEGRPPVDASRFQVESIEADRAVVKYAYFQWRERSYGVAVLKKVDGEWRVHEDYAFDGYVERHPEICPTCALFHDEAALDPLVVHADDTVVAFASPSPVLEGHLVIAPREHRERAIEDLTGNDHLALQRVIHRLAKALDEEKEEQRVAVLTLDGQMEDQHVRWHLIPIPAGTSQSEVAAAVTRLLEGAAP